MQIQTPIQLTQVPPKPTCTQIFNTGSCADLWRNYNQAVQQRTREKLQMYVNRQKELASSQATAPLQQQITGLNQLVTDQQGQIKKLQDQIQADSANAVQQSQATSAATIKATAEAHTQGVQQGAGIGVAVALALYGAVYAFKRFSGNFTVTKKPQAQAAGAGK